MHIALDLRAALRKGDPAIVLSIPFTLLYSTGPLHYVHTRTGLGLKRESTWNTSRQSSRQEKLPSRSIPLADALDAL